MVYNENLHEEEQHLIQQIAEQTERGKIDWELTEYNPLSFLKMCIRDRDDLCRIKLPVPSYARQCEIVESYRAITNRIALKRAENDNLAA